MSVHRGLFITFEGIDGAGKSTNLKHFSKLLGEQGIEVETSREPGGTPIGEKIRSILVDSALDPIDSYSELLLMLAARAQHISSRIQPALESGKWFLCDRFSDATYAYQGGGRGIDFSDIKTIEKIVGIKLQPDCTFLFDVSPEIGLARAFNRGMPDRFESEHVEFYNRVRCAYKDLAKRHPERWCLIDATESVQRIEKLVKAQCHALLSFWRKRL